MAAAHQEYLKKSTNEVAVFADSLKDNAVNKSSGTFDSAAATDFITTATNQNAGVKVPEKLQVLLDELGEKGKSAVIKAVLDGVGIYEKQHGCEPPADLIEQAFHSAYTTTEEAIRKYKLPNPMLDSAADSNHSENTSLQQNRAVVAILSAMGDAIPVAHYLPADISSNESKLAIMSHKAGSTFGNYAENDSLDGTNSGNPYITGARIHKMTPAVSTGNITGKLTRLQDTDVTCDQAADAIKLQRGRAILYVNGKIAAREVPSTGSGNANMSGSIKLGDTTYTIGGTINTDTGAFAITTTPAMPDTTPVAVESFIDFERDPSLTPSIISGVETFVLYAHAWRAYAQTTIDTRTQMANELGLDPYSESIIAMQTQFANERHYKVLRRALMLAVNNTETFDFEWAERSAQLLKSQIWQDFFSVLSAMSQQMAEDTKDHGITHLYVAKNVAAMFMSLPNTVFQPSGLMPRPQIYRLGRLLGLYDVYYTPKIVTEASTSANILCIGRGTSVPLNPFVLGDAVPPTMIPLAVGIDLKQGGGFYARNFTEVNPYDLAANGCALLQITNMPTNV